MHRLQPKQERCVESLLKAYDIILQSEVSARQAARNGDFEPYRYICSCCREEVYISAAYSRIMVPYFKHRNGNNDVECINYLGNGSTAGHGFPPLQNKYENAELYYEKKTKTFCLGFRFNSDEISDCENHNVVYELMSSNKDQSVFSIKINSKNFAPDTLTLIPISIFFSRYLLFNTLNKDEQDYILFKSHALPTLFRFTGNDSGNNAKIVRSKALYTKIRYFVVFQKLSSMAQVVDLLNEINVEDSFLFNTMGRTFFGLVMTITQKTAQIDRLIQSWGFKLEISESLTLLWPPATIVNDISTIGSDHVFLFTTFTLLANSNINIDSSEINMVTKEISKVSVKPRTKVFKKNSEIIICKREQYNVAFNELILMKETSNMHTVTEDCTCFLFRCNGAKKLDKGQRVPLTPKSEIRCYDHGYFVKLITSQKPDQMTGYNLLVDILCHYKCTETIDINRYGSCMLSKTASLYIDKCITSGIINTVARRFIEEGLL